MVRSKIMLALWNVLTDGSCAERAPNRFQEERARRQQDASSRRVSDEKYCNSLWLFLLVQSRLASQPESRRAGGSIAGCRTSCGSA